MSSLICKIYYIVQLNASYKIKVVYVLLDLFEYEKGEKCIGSRTCSHGLPLSEVGGHDPSVEDLDGVVPLGRLANVQAELTKLNVVLHPPAYPDLVADQKNISNLLM